MNFAVLFDLNGTVVDTENAHASAYAEVLKKYDIDFTIEQFSDNWSRQGKKLADYLEAIGRSDLLPKAKEIKKEKDEIFRVTLAQKAQLRARVVGLLQRLKSGGLKLGLESSSPKVNVDKVLEHFDLSEYFDQIVPLDSGLDESKYGSHEKKSSRLKYLAYLLGFTHDHCILIGDAEKDMIGAREAGMKAVAVPSEYTKDNDFKHADKILTGFEEIDIDFLKKL